MEGIDPELCACCQITSRRDSVQLNGMTEWTRSVINIEMASRYLELAASSQPAFHTRMLALFDSKCVRQDLLSHRAARWDHTCSLISITNIAIHASLHLSPFLSHTVTSIFDLPASATRSPCCRQIGLRQPELYFSYK